MFKMMTALDANQGLDVKSASRGFYWLIIDYEQNSIYFGIGGKWGLNRCMKRLRELWEMDKNYG